VTDPVATALPEIGAELERLGRSHGGLAHLRERHLKQAVHSVLARCTGATVVECNLAVPGWPLLGRSTTDAVVESKPGSRLPTLVAELKWITATGEVKIYEAIWDAFKMALESKLPNVTGAYLITGAPTAAWKRDPCVDLFTSCTHSVDELCERRSRSPKRWLIWDWLLEGGNDRAPDYVPSPFRTVALQSVVVGSAHQTWELRAARVEVADDAEHVPFINRWPRGTSPADARSGRPQTAAPDARDRLAGTDH
jgi:hypothetical protein